MYMGLDKNNRPNGWGIEPVDGYIEVDDSVYEVASLNPDYVWNGTELVAPAVSDQAVYTPTYQDKRRELYGPIEEQLDMQYWDNVNGTTTWIDRIASVKSSVPKPQ